jgi:hypothetical protein
MSIKMEDRCSRRLSPWNIIPFAVLSV